MSRPSLPIKMVQCATSALLAAIEICNKPNLDYREQTFALLTVNAWEIFLKARIVQQKGGKIQSIYRRKDAIRYKRTKEGEPITISLDMALNLANPPDIVKDNIKGLSLVRNQIAHLGMVSVDLQVIILQYGTASIKNFVNLSQKWFGQEVKIPFYLPVGFIGDIKMIGKPAVGRQKILLNVLQNFARQHSNDESGYAVALRVDVNLDTDLKGGGTIGFTKDPSAMRVQISDDEALRNFSMTYQELIQLCRDRYPNFKQNSRFYNIMKKVKADANCTFIRKLDPKNPRSLSKSYYNWNETQKILDKEYFI